MGVWAKGTSGNPNGRPKIAREVRDAARVNCMDAFKRVLAIAHDDEHRDHFKALTLVLKLAGAIVNWEPDEDEKQERAFVSADHATEALEADLGPTGAIQ